MEKRGERKEGVPVLALAKCLLASYGDGNVAVILKRLSASGFDGFLSLEPHLFEFEGFHALEKDGRSIAVKEKKVLSGLETFTIAHDALMKLLDNCM